MPFKPHIFLTSTNKKQDLPNLANEFEGIREHLRIAEDKNLCQIEERCNFRPENLPKIFNNKNFENKITIFHYSGHANSEQIDKIYGEGLAGLLSTQKNLALVFFNACSTENHINFFNKYTPKVPCIIVTDKAIEDRVASEFAQHFYKSLGIGNNIDTAFRKAEATIMSKDDKEIWNIGLRRSQIKNRVPWKIHYNNESFKEWSLPKAADNPLALISDLEFVTKNLPDAPFIGLKPYQTDYAPIFFGRDYEIGDLYFKAIDENDHNIILISGQSGAGKSSLLTAGLLPRLEKHFFCEEEYYFRRSQKNGLPYILRYFLETDHIESFQNKWLALEEKHQKPLLLVIDQVEEIFTSQAHIDEKKVFFEQIQAIFGQNNLNEHIKGKLIISFRKEYVPEMRKQFKEYNIRHQIPYFVETLQQKNIIQAITGITTPPYSNTQNAIIQEKYGLEIEPGLAENIANELLLDDKSAIAPSLQILLSEMWARIEDSNKRKFTIEQHRNLKAKTLEQYLEQEIELLKENEAYKPYVESGLVLSLLKKYTTEEITANEYDVEVNGKTDFENSAIITELVENMQKMYLLTGLTNNNKTYHKNEIVTRLAHDTLARYVHKKYNERKYPAQKAETILKAHSETNDGILSIEELEIVKQGRLGMYKLTPSQIALIKRSEQHHDKKRRVKKIKRFGGITILILVMLFSGQFITISFVWVLLLVILMYYI